MLTTPAECLLLDAMDRVDPSAGQRWRESSAIENADQASRVLVNGVAVPVVRVARGDTEDFFDVVHELANEQFFDGGLPEYRRIWNRRFRSVAGRIDVRRQVIELSSAHDEACGSVALGIVYLHELIHLDLFVRGRPIGHTGEFKRLSRSLGMPDIRHQLPLPARLGKKRLHRYACPTGCSLESLVRFRAPRACAACCRAYAGGRYDSRYRLRYLGPVPSPNAPG